MRHSEELWWFDCGLVPRMAAVGSERKRKKEQAEQDKGWGVVLVGVGEWRNERCGRNE